MSFLSNLTSKITPAMKSTAWGTLGTSLLGATAGLVGGSVVNNDALGGAGLGAVAGLGLGLAAPARAGAKAAYAWGKSTYQGGTAPIAKSLARGLKGKAGMIALGGVAGAATGPTDSTLANFGMGAAGTAFLLHGRMAKGGLHRTLREGAANYASKSLSHLDDTGRLIRQSGPMQASGWSPEQLRGLPWSLRTNTGPSAMHSQSRMLYAGNTAISPGHVRGMAKTAATAGLAMTGGVGAGMAYRGIAMAGHAMIGGSRRDKGYNQLNK